MKAGTTHIDTIKLMIDTYDQEQQYETLLSIVNALSTVPFAFMKSTTQQSDGSLGKPTIEKVHYVMYKGKKIAAVTTGRYITRCYGVSDCIDVYYVAVSFYGLTRHHISDTGSRQCLLSLCKYINNNQIIFRITQLDVCLDIKAPFENILTLLTRRVPNVRYFMPDEVHDNGKIRRIEHVSAGRYNKASVRAYTYDKMAKNPWIKYDLTRFELKFNSSFFKGVDKPMTAIKKAIDRYTIMYFEDLQTRSTVLARYTEQWDCKKIDISKLDIEKYTLTVDIDYVSEFIEMLFTIDDDIPYEYLMPTRDKEALAREKNKSLGGPT